MKKIFLFGFGVLLVASVFAATGKTLIPSVDDPAPAPVPVGTSFEIELLDDNDGELFEKEVSDTVSHQEFNILTRALKQITDVFVGTTFSPALNNRLFVPRNVVIDGQLNVNGQVCINNDCEWADGTGSGLPLYIVDGETTQYTILPSEESGRTLLDGTGFNVVSGVSLGNATNWFQNLWVEDLHVGNGTVTMGTGEPGDEEVSVLSRNTDGQVKLSGGQNKELKMKTEGTGTLGVVSQKGSVNIEIEGGISGESDDPDEEPVVKDIVLQNNAISGNVNVGTTTGIISMKAPEVVMGAMTAPTKLSVKGDIDFTGNLYKGGELFDVGDTQYTWGNGAFTECGDEGGLFIGYDQEEQLKTLRAARAFLNNQVPKDTEKIQEFDTLIGLINKDLNDIADAVIDQFKVPMEVNGTVYSSRESYLMHKKIEMQVRSVYCYDEMGTIVADGYCAHLGNRPSGFQACNIDQETGYSWHVGEYNACGANQEKMYEQYARAESEFEGEREVLAELQKLKTSYKEWYPALPAAPVANRTTQEERMYSWAVPVYQGILNDIAVLTSRLDIYVPPRPYPDLEVQEVKDKLTFFPTAFAEATLSGFQEIGDLLKQDFVYSVPGIQSREVVCRNSAGAIATSTAYCIDDKPEEFSTCPLSATYSWEADPDWGTCVASTPGRREIAKKEVYAGDIGNAKAKTVDPDMYAILGTAQTSAIKAANRAVEVEATAFADKLKAGTQTRSVVCQQDIEGLPITIVQDKYCASLTRPLDIQSCPVSLPTYQWVTPSGGATCGIGIEEKIMSQQAMVADLQEYIDALQAKLTTMATVPAVKSLGDGSTNADRTQYLSVEQKKAIIAEKALVVALRDKINQEITYIGLHKYPEDDDFASYLPQYPLCYRGETRVDPWLCLATSKPDGLEPCNSSGVIPWWIPVTAIHTRPAAAN